MSKRQSRYKIWANQNKRDNGFSEQPDDLYNSIKTSKQQEYETLKSSISDSEKIRMRELLYVSKSKIEFLSRLEDERINLTYLVALGITTEEDIQSYLTLRDRGIDTYGIQDSAKAKRVDSEYLREIEMIRENYPNLKNIKGKDIQSTLNLDEYLKSDVVLKKEVIEKPKTIRESKGNVDDAPNINIDLEELDKESASTPEEIKKAKDWGQLIKNLTSKTDELTNDSGERIVGPSYMEIDDKVRNVYILADKFPTPDIEGYNFIFIDSSNSFNKFSINKNNLLILTSDIPEYLKSDLASWIKGVMNFGEKFRIATLRTSPLDADIVQGTLVRLDKECLDEFYNQHSTEEYIGKTEGSFLDLTSIVEESEELL